MRKILLRLLLLICTAQLASAEESVADWFTVPANESAIALYVPDDASSRDLVVVVKDSGGEKLDAFEWGKKLPFVRQYRVPPGEYRINVEGVGTFLTQAKGGEVSYLVMQSEPDGFLAAFKGGVDTDKFSELLAAIKESGGEAAIKPVYFAPAKNELYITVAGPGVKPPPN